VALRKDGLRGQAFVIFEEAASATEALQKENGFVLFGKPLKIEFSNAKSDRISKRDGTYVPKAKRIKQEKKKETTTAPPPAQDVTAQQPTPTSASNASPPSHILLATDLPSECNEMMLAMLFRQYTGFKEVRIPREGLAFVEFETEPHATLALERLDGFALTTNDKLKLTYGKA
jgi:U2 small nuclear ribonucleoprotein B''